MYSQHPFMMVLRDKLVALMKNSRPYDIERNVDKFLDEHVLEIGMHIINSQELEDHAIELPEFNLDHETDYKAARQLADAIVRDKWWVRNERKTDYGKEYTYRMFFFKS